MGGCRSTVLASGPCAEVARCSCGHVHLNLGPLTIRLEDSVLRAVTITLGEAVARIEDEGEGRWLGVADGGLAWKQ